MRKGCGKAIGIGPTVVPPTLAQQVVIGRLSTLYRVDIGSITKTVHPMRSKKARQIKGRVRRLINGRSQKKIEKKK